LAARNVDVAAKGGGGCEVACGNGGRLAGGMDSGLSLTSGGR
jgi:hypothetical protein